MSQMVLGSLAHLPSSDYGQELLLRILCYVAQLNGRVTPSESEFVETVAGAMGHRAWEFPEAPTRLSLRDLAGLRSTWSSSSERIWLTALFRRLAAADGIVCKDEELFLDELTALLFSSLPTGTRSIARSELASDEQQVITAAINAADSIAVTDLWHRKTGKAVGAALGVETEQGFEIFTGVNFELSQPTGSRCAEQVAIGRGVRKFALAGAQCERGNAGRGLAEGDAQGCALGRRRAWALHDRPLGRQTFGQDVRKRIRQGIGIGSLVG